MSEGAWQVVISIGILSLVGFKCWAFWGLCDSLGESETIEWKLRQLKRERRDEL